MSKIGKKPILIPQGVQVKIEDQKIIVKGPHGELEKIITPEIKIESDGEKILVFPKKDSKKTKALWGTFRQIIFNMIEGVTKGFEKKLEIEGLGYKAYLEGENLILEVGFSHPIKIEKPSGIKFLVNKNIISVWGVDKELVGQLAANIRKIKIPDPYKAKGIKYLGEKIKRKTAKKAIAAK